MFDASSPSSEKDAQQILIVPKEFGSVWLPTLCFLVGMLTFALLANAVMNTRKNNLLAEQKNILLVAEKTSNIKVTKRKVYAKNRTKIIQRKKKTNW